jgi:hypothetical protein
MIQLILFLYLSPALIQPSPDFKDSPSSFAMMGTEVPAPAIHVPSTNALVEIEFSRSTNTTVTVYALLVSNVSSVFHAVMPCGNEYWLHWGDRLPTNNIPCPCGNTNHWIFRIEDTAPKYMSTP